LLSLPPHNYWGILGVGTMFNPTITGVLQVCGHQIESYKAILQLSLSLIT
jgi:hypothetical protein